MENSKDEMKMTKEMVQRLKQLSCLNALYGGGPEFSPYSSIPQPFIPDL